MEAAHIYQKLTATFRDVFDDESIVAVPEMTADDVQDWDSLSHIQLIVAIEKAFQIKFSTSEIARLQNVGELAALIQSKLTKSATASG